MVPNRHFRQGDFLTCAVQLINVLACGLAPTWLYIRLDYGIIDLDSCWRKLISPEPIMPKREPPPEAGAPLWMCTYGDLMSLLLCFFVMLFALSNIIDAKWEALIKTMEGKMGYTGLAKKESRGTKPAAAAFSISERSRRTAALGGAQPILGRGDQDSQQQITLSGDIVKGGLIRFGLGSDDLNAQAKENLERLLPTLLDASPKILVKGYAAPTEIESGFYSRDYFLAHARAIKVMDYLIELGLKKEYFQVSVSDSATIPNRLILPAQERADPKLAGASAAIYLLSDTPRPLPNENGEQ